MSGICEPTRSPILCASMLTHCAANWAIWRKRHATSRLLSVKGIDWARPLIRRKPHEISPPSTSLAPEKAAPAAATAAGAEFCAVADHKHRCDQHLPPHNKK